MEKQLEEMRQQMAVLKEKLDKQKIVNEHLILDSIHHKTSAISRHYAIIGILDVALIPYSYWAFVVLNGSSLGVWIYVSILLLIALAYTIYTGQYIRNKSLYFSNLVEARKRVAYAKKLDHNWLWFGLPAILIWLFYFCIDSVQQSQEPMGWYITISGCAVGGAIAGLRIHFNIQRKYQEIIEQIKEIENEE